jgi:hypothetical protein
MEAPSLGSRVHLSFLARLSLDQLLPGERARVARRLRLLGRDAVSSERLRKLPSWEDRWVLRASPHYAAFFEREDGEIHVLDIVGYDLIEHFAELKEREEAASS